jgi:hypothetical protein
MDLPVGTAGRPPVFWEFDPDELPGTPELGEVDADTCHVKCTGITEKDWDDFVEAFDPLNLQICDGNGYGPSRKITQEDIDALIGQD